MCNPHGLRCEASLVSPAEIATPSPQGAERDLFVRYGTYARILAALRQHSAESGISEFLPPRHIAGYAHTPSEHFVVRDARDHELILPHQLSLFNRLATHFLDRPTYCLGPCYRNETPAPNRLTAFYQFSVEIFTEDFADLVTHVSGLVDALLNTFGRRTSALRTLDLREPGSPTNDEIVAEVDRTGAPHIVLYKRRGIPPLLNRLQGPDLEVGLELILPGVGETIDGGLRDPEVVRQIYRVNTTRQTAGASVGLERLASYLLDEPDISSAQLL
jgi:hypothetical protein